MNETLTIIFFEDYFVCTILPNENAWQTLRINGADKQHLYFYVNGNEIRNDDFAKERFEAGDTCAFGNFYTLITGNTQTFYRFGIENDMVCLLKELMEQVKEVYVERMSDFKAVNIHKKIPLNVCFVPGISLASRKVIIDFLASDGFDPNNVDYFEALLNILFRKRIIDEMVNFSIIESYLGDMWMHYIEFNKKILKQESEFVIGKGVDYRIGNLARLIVEKAARKSSSSLLFNKVMLEQEIKKFHKKASSEVDNFMYGELDVTVALSDYHTARVIIDMRELDKMSSETFQFIKFKYESFISRHSNVARTGRIFLNGESVSSKAIIDFFEKEFGTNKIIRPFENFEELLSRGVFNLATPVSEKKESIGSIEINIKILSPSKPPPLPPRPGNSAGSKQQPAPPPKPATPPKLMDRKTQTQTQVHSQSGKKPLPPPLPVPVKGKNNGPNTEKNKKTGQPVTPLIPTTPSKKSNR